MHLNEKDKSKQISSATLSSPAKRTKARKLASSTVQFLYERYVGADRNSKKEYEDEVLNAAIARKIYALRTKAGLSQRDLAKKVGTSASAICRLEDADYEGHSLSLLKRIAEALDSRVEIRFVSVKPRRSA